MSNKYPTLNPKQIEKILKAAGFVKKKRISGSHAYWEGYTHGKRRVVTLKKLKSKTEVFGRDTLRSIISQSGLSKKEFYNYL